MGETYIEQLAEFLVWKVGYLGVERANLDVWLLYDKFLLGKTFSAHQVSVIVQFGLELLGCGLREHVE